MCPALITHRNMAKHIRNLHPARDMAVPCSMCEKVFKNVYNMKDHLRRTHGVWQRDNF